MEQTKALNALEPFLALTKSASTPRQAADLITRATSAPNTYLFAPLLASPQIRALSNSQEYSPYLTLLNIFSHGTYSSYLTTTSSSPPLPALTPAQLLKIRQLTLVSLASSRQLTYPHLISALGLSTPSELEDLVTSSIYASLVKATLDPASQQVHIHSVSALRDVAPQSIPSLLDSLKDWAGRCETALANLESRVETVRRRADDRARDAREWEARVAGLVEGEKDALNAAAAAGGGGFFDGQQGGYGHGSGGHGGQGLPARSGGGGGGGKTARYGKRGSGHMDGAGEGDDVDDEAMDLDEVDEVGEKKRTSRRKL